MKRLKQVKQLKRVKHLAEAAAGRSKARERRPQRRIIDPDAFDLIVAAHNTFAANARNIASNGYIRIGLDTHIRETAVAGPPPPNTNPRSVPRTPHQNNRITDTTHRSR
ncbi:MAG: hypothetical protein KF762_05980 [Acidobacteria bacterium]|nr:hypothetical protein [Acidobacteriota bacterium]